MLMDLWMILKPLKHVCPLQLEISAQLFNLQPVRYEVINSYINRKHASFACIQTVCARCTKSHCILTDIFLLPFAEAFCSLWTCQAFRAWARTRVRGGLLCCTPRQADEGAGPKRGDCPPINWLLCMSPAMNTYNLHEAAN